ncbi:hypothetical protein OH786_18080 [Streptomyces atratus]|jgi:hypothetical protein|uniref:Uncharacterized protein n=1 Tax=Streptomyces atratus TaxID=1893 RepID=A0A1K2EEB5_STRAR|nr:hypothetical protein [Streptomyces atratus]SFY34039.1 hypothetical protein SAMN02787144_101920 [Streptomyces atratus]
MARQLRMLGTTSEEGKCPTLYEDTQTGDIIVQGYTVDDPEDIAQLANILDGESFVVVPRDLLTRFGPKE